MPDCNIHTTHNWNVQRCSQVKVMQQLQKALQTFRQRVLLMHTRKYPNCKQFIGPLLSLGLSNNPKMWQLHGCLQDVWEVLSHGAQLVLNYMGHMQRGVLSQQDDTIPSVNLPIFILDFCMQIWSIWKLQFALLHDLQSRNKDLQCQRIKH